MEITINGKKYMFKEELSAKEENLTGIKKYFVKLMGLEKKDQNELMKMIFDEEFDKTAIKMVHFLLINPKLTEDEILDLPSSDVMELKLRCLMIYIESLESLSNLQDLQKKKIPNFSQMECSSFLEMKQSPPCNGLPSDKKLLQHIK